MHVVADRRFARISALAWTAGGLTGIGLATHLATGGSLEWLGTTMLGAALVAWGAMLALRLRLRADLVRRDAGYLGMFEGHPQPILLADNATLAIVGVNRAAKAKYGYSDEEFAGLTIFDLHRREDRDDVRAGWADTANSAGVARSVGLHVTRDGTTFAADVMSTTLEIDGRPVRMKVVIDVTEREDALEQAREQGARYRQVVDLAREGVVTVTPDLSIGEINPQAAEMLGYATDELVGRSISELAEPGEAQLWSESALQGERETSLVAKDGSSVPVLVRGSPLTDRAGQYSGQLGMVTDLTALKELEDELEFAAIHDSLTGLPSRLLLVDRLERAVGRVAPGQSEVAVVLVGLDGFKAVNNAHGDVAGDALLVEVGRRLSDCVSADDSLARFGGDEFVIVSEGADGFARTLATRVRDALAGVATEDVPAGVTASLGVAVGHQGDRPAALLRDADIAMLQAKASGRDRIEFVTDALRATSRDRLILISELRQAIVQQEFTLRFQPVVSLLDGRILGAEALIRWEHPRRGLLSPDKFIAIAEETGLIVPIGQWVVEEACRCFAGWQGLMPELTMSINVSAQQLTASPDVTFGSALAGSGIDPSNLIVEITESVLMDDVGLSTRVLTNLRDTGVKLAIDDFGTGYSSLAYLKLFPIDILKIDQSFVAGLPDDTYDSALIQAVMAVADSLRLEVTAEGVETAAQARTLLALGCRTAQGFLFYRPLTADDFEAALRNPIEKSRVIATEAHPRRR